MKRQKLNPNFAQITLLVPKLFLKRFDNAIQDFFPCRSEAIRRGMDLIMEEVKHSREEARP
jgi:metal-responsive CopG/Arc/MetJ family transcriptional regulator